MKKETIPQYITVELAEEKTLLFPRAKIVFLRGPALKLKAILLLLPPCPPHREGTASRGLSLNRSQYGGCSTKYNTPTGIQVVCRRFAGEQVVFPKSSTELKLEQ